MVDLTGKDAGRIRWAIRGDERRVLQQAIYIIESDSVEWRNVQEIFFPVPDFEPKT